MELVFVSTVEKKFNVQETWPTMCEAKKKKKASLSDYNDLNKEKDVGGVVTAGKIFPRCVQRRNCFVLCSVECIGILRSFGVNGFCRKKKKEFSHTACAKKKTSQHAPRAVSAK